MFDIIEEKLYGQYFSPNDFGFVSFILIFIIMYSWPLNNTDLNWMGPLVLGFFTTVIQDPWLVEFFHVELGTCGADCRVITGFLSLLVWGQGLAFLTPLRCSRINHTFTAITRICSIKSLSKWKGKCNSEFGWYCQIPFIEVVQGFPGGAVVKSLPANLGDTGLSPGLGGSHVPWSSWARAPQLLSLHSGDHEPQLLRPAHLEPVLCNKRSRHNKKPAHRSKERPPLAATRWGLRTAMKTQHSQKYK